MDLDDTLLKDDLTISDRTCEALSACDELGIRIMLASGRAPEAMFSFAGRIGIDKRPSHIICHNGSQAIESDTGKVVVEHYLPPDIAVEAFRLTKDAGLSCHVYEGNLIHVSRETEFSDRDRMLSGLQPVIPADYERLVSEGVFKLVIPGDPEFIVPIEAELKVHFAGRATVFVSKPFFLEILPAGVGKGETLRDIAEGLLGIGRDRVMAFGDSMNDETMIEYAGMGVAMKNARREILGIADFVTDKTNDEDGIADFLERFVL